MSDGRQYRVTSPEILVYSLRFRRRFNDYQAVFLLAIERGRLFLRFPGRRRFRGPAFDCRHAASSYGSFSHNQSSVNLTKPPASDSFLFDPPKLRLYSSPF
jgi:hypothetical protein